MNVTRNNIVAVIKTWGPIYEFTFDMRINVIPEWGIPRRRHTGHCNSAAESFNTGMVMRLGADGPNSRTRTSLSMAPIVFLGLGRIFICIHNRTNPNEALQSIYRQPVDVCGNGCLLEQVPYIGIPKNCLLYFLSFDSLRLQLNLSNPNLDDNNDCPKEN